MGNICGKYSFLNGYIIWDTVFKGKNRIPEYYVSLVYSDDLDVIARVNHSGYILPVFKNALQNNQLMIDELDYKLPVAYHPNNITPFTHLHYFEERKQYELYIKKTKNIIPVKMYDDLYTEKDIYEKMKRTINRNGHDFKKVYLNIAIQYVDKEYIKNNIIFGS